MTHMRFSIFLFIKLSLVSTHAIQYPVSPGDPEDSFREKETASSNQNSEENFSSMTIRVTFASGDELSGTARMPSSVIFYHYRKGLSYKKQLQISEIKSIKVISWNGRIISERDPLAKVYEFHPNDVLIQTRDGKEYRTGAIFPFLRKVPLSTDDGDTVVFSYFADSYSEKNGWRDVSSKDPDYHQSNPHPLTVIRFDLDAD